MKYKRALFIFRRDLRLVDNTGLNSALEHASEVIPLFLLDPRQLHKHQYRSIPGLQFLFTSLKELQTSLREQQSDLHLAYGIAEEVLGEILRQTKSEACFINRDYTPFSTHRDEKILETCRSFGVQLHGYHDAVLLDPRQTIKDDGSPYTVFTPYYKKNSQCVPKPPVPLHANGGILSRFDSPILKDISYLSELLPQTLESPYRRGGRKEALSIIEHTIPKLTHYTVERNIPAIDGTSGLSAHLKFGTASVREVYWSAKKNLSTDDTFISELYWRDFFTGIGYFFPRVFGNPFHERFRDLEWDTDNERLARWCNGETGFPIVDAGMRQLNTIGWMHNRVRMITASFLIKDLHIDWRIGEQYFAQKLIDYDPAVNNGSWQWAASTGCDAQPYFRIFNPWLQQKKFDPDAIYIKRWIPELQPYSAKQIHDIGSGKLLLGYSPPIVDHSVEKTITEKRYAAVLKK